MLSCAVIWDALKAACEADLQTAALIVESAGIIVSVPDMSTCFDERGKLKLLTSDKSTLVISSGIHAEFPNLRQNNCCAAFREQV